MQAWQRLDDGADVTKSGFRQIVHKQFRTNSGTVGRADIIDPEHSKGASVVALTPDNEVVIARQFRCGPELICDELPGGFVDEGETTESAALRELTEETGYRAKNIDYLGKLHNDGWSNSSHYYYFATDCEKITDELKLDPFEEVEVDTISISQLFDNAKNSRMTDVQAVFFAYERLKELENKV